MDTYINVVPAQELIRVVAVPERSADMHGRRNGAVHGDAIIGMDGPGCHGQAGSGPGHGVDGAGGARRSV